MAETLPRWGLKPVDFIETDATTIQAEIISDYEDKVDETLANGDPVRLILLTHANREVGLRNCINISAQQNLLSYAQKENLDALGENQDVDRLQESYAITTLQFKLVQSLGEAYAIPKNFEVTNGDITFATNEELIIPAGELRGEVLATCTTAGAIGNGYVAGQITTIVTPMTFLESATNTTTSSGGADKEDDDEYADRIRLAPNSYSVAGPKKAYEYHTQTVSSAIIDVKPTTVRGTGEVKLYILLEGGELPNKDIIELVEAYFEVGDKTPMTDYVQVLAPTVKEYQINVDYWINTDDISVGETIRKEVDIAVEDYRLWQQTAIGRDIDPGELISRVKTAGAGKIDFSTLTPASYVELADGEVAQCTGVVVNFKGYKDE